jgi:hypothetical protein
MYTQKAGLIFGGNPAKDKPHGLPLCWVACGGVLWCPEWYRSFNATRISLLTIRTGDCNFVGDINTSLPNGNPHGIWAKGKEKASQDEQGLSRERDDIVA